MAAEPEHAPPRLGNRRLPLAMLESAPLLHRDRGRSRLPPLLCMGILEGEARRPLRSTHESPDRESPWLWTGSPSRGRRGAAFGLGERSAKGRSVDSFSVPVLASLAETKFPEKRGTAAPFHAPPVSARVPKNPLEEPSKSAINT